jgi:hypothetical protein
MSTPVTSSRVDGTWARPKSLTRSTRSAQSAKLWRSRTLWRLPGEDRLRERLPPDRQDMAAALGEFIQKAHAVVGQGHVARHRHGAPAEQPHIREGMVGRATRAGRDQRCPVAGVKALGEPAADQCQQLPGLGAFALLLPQAAQAHRRPQLQRPGLLATGNMQRLVEADFCLHVRVYPQCQQQFSLQTIELCLP